MDGVGSTGMAGRGCRTILKKTNQTYKTYTFQWRRVGVDMLGLRLRLATAVTGTGGASLLDKAEAGQGVIR